MVRPAGDSGGRTEQAGSSPPKAGARGGSSGGGSRGGVDVQSFNFKKMIQGLEDHVRLVKKYLDELGKSTTGDVNLGMMFNLQFHMQVMSQYIEAVSNVLSGIHGSMITLARATKGQ